MLNSLPRGRFFALRSRVNTVSTERRRRVSDDPFFASPEEVHCGHVGALADHAALLKRIADAIFREGEHSDGT